MFQIKPADPKITDFHKAANALIHGITQLDSKDEVKRAELIKIIDQLPLDYLVRQYSANIDESEFQGTLLHLTIRCDQPELTLHLIKTVKKKLQEAKKEWDEKEIEAKVELHEDNIYGFLFAWLTGADNTDQMAIAYVDLISNEGLKAELQSALKTEAGWSKPPGGPGKNFLHIEVQRAIRENDPTIIITALDEIEEKYPRCLFALINQRDSDQLTPLMYLLSPNAEILFGGVIPKLLANGSWFTLHFSFEEENDSRSRYPGTIWWRYYLPHILLVIPYLTFKEKAQYHILHYLLIAERDQLPAGRIEKEILSILSGLQKDSSLLLAKDYPLVSEFTILTCLILTATVGDLQKAIGAYKSSGKNDEDIREMLNLPIRGRGQKAKDASNQLQIIHNYDKAIKDPANIYELIKLGATTAGIEHDVEAVERSKFPNTRICQAVLNCKKALNKLANSEDKFDDAYRDLKSAVDILDQKVFARIMIDLFNGQQGFFQKKLDVRDTTQYKKFSWLCAILMKLYGHHKDKVARATIFSLIGTFYQHTHVDKSSWLHVITGWCSCWSRATTPSRVRTLYQPLNADDNDTSNDTLKAAAYFYSVDFESLDKSRGELYLEDYELTRNSVVISLANRKLSAEEKTEHPSRYAVDSDPKKHPKYNEVMADIEAMQKQLGISAIQLVSSASASAVAPSPGSLDEDIPTTVTVPRLE